MTRHEERLAWRAYAAGALSLAEKFPLAAVEEIADRMLAAEQQRFDAPDADAQTHEVEAAEPQGFAKWLQMESGMSEQAVKAQDIGALWEETSKAGRRFLWGTIDGKRIVVRGNVHKRPGERTPHWRIYEDTQHAPDVEQASRPALGQQTPVGLEVTR